MSDSPPPSEAAGRAMPDPQQAVLFANLVSQQVNLALLFLGKVPAEDGAKPRVDLDLAGVCIDTLEMLAAKTRGNLSPPEQEMLQRNLTALRMLFVAAVDHAGAAPTPATPPAAETGAAAATAPSVETPAAKPAGESGDAPKRFVKKY